MSESKKSITKQFIRWLILTLSVGFVTAQDRQTASRGGEPKAVKTGTIGGRVVNESGEPLHNATVMLRPFGSSFVSQTTNTDREGTFEFSGLARAIYLLSAHLPAYITAPRDPNSTQATSYRVGDRATLMLIKGGVITGIVTSYSGEPVVGVRVRVQMLTDIYGQRTRYGAQISERATDDRGVYRFYGLPPGTYVVMAGGMGYLGSAIYANHAPTYSPSSTRDTAAQVIVQAGAETTNVDIQYRSDFGRNVSGTVTGPKGNTTSYSITLTSTSDAGSQWSENTHQSPGVEGFMFSGVADGDYYVTAHTFSSGVDRLVSNPRRIQVTGADVTGVELETHSLSSISGRVVVEDSKVPECTDNRRGSVTEMLVSAWHNQKEVAKDQPQFIWSMGAPQYPNEKGEIALRNLFPGQYQLVTRVFAKHWYVRSVVLPSPTNPTSGLGTSRLIDAVANWTTLRRGQNLSGMVVTVSEGASSLEGHVTLSEGQALPGGLHAYLVPVEAEKEQDVLRFYASPISADRKITLNHIAPGRYWIVLQPALDDGTPTLTKLRLPDEKATRSRLRRAAEAAKIEIEFKPCQNVTDYQLPLDSRASRLLTTPNP